jgi:hypothetical protein
VQLHAFPIALSNIQLIAIFVHLPVLWPKTVSSWNLNLRFLV